MADIQVFRIGDRVEEIKGSNFALERKLQNIIEGNMLQFFGVEFLATEYATNNGGRMDSIGIDENYCPVIFEYKRLQNENVINQSLFYLDWLLGHKDSFKVLVIEKLGMERAKYISWDNPRVVCIAGDFSKYDIHAINQMPRSISLIRYKQFGDDLLMFEKVGEHISEYRRPIMVDQSANKDNSHIVVNTTASNIVIDSNTNILDVLEDDADSITARDTLDKCSSSIKELFATMQDYIFGLGDDIACTVTKFWFAYKKIKNIICVVPYKKWFYITLSLDVNTVEFDNGFAKDMTGIGHWGTGDVRVIIKNEADLERTKHLFDRAYKEN